MSIQLGGPRRMGVRLPVAQVQRLRGPARFAKRSRFSAIVVQRHLWSADQYSDSLTASSLAHSKRTFMTTNAATTISSAATPLVEAAPRHVSLADAAKLAATQPVAQNDADGDLKADLASGENPSQTLGSNVNVKA
jgi:hypothetical protein